jgi:hypothetical protein
LKVVHIIEALAGGVYTYFRDLSTYFGDEEINKSTQTTIIYIVEIEKKLILKK